MPSVGLPSSSCGKVCDSERPTSGERGGSDMAEDAETGWTDLDEQRSHTDRPDRREERGTGVSKWSLLLLVLAILLAIIMGQNTERVAVEVLWTEFTTPLFLVVLLVGLGLTVLWEVGTLVFRHRRRRARNA